MKKFSTEFLADSLPGALDQMRSNLDGSRRFESGADTSIRFIDEVLAGPKHLTREAFQQACRAFDCEPHVVDVSFRPGGDVDTELISNLVRRYGVSLVRGRAVVLLDAVEFSRHSPLEQMAMLNSLAYSVNSAYRQLLSKDIQVNFARTTTGDGFYIWNRAKTVDANNALYKADDDDPRR